MESGIVRAASAHDMKTDDVRDRPFSVLIADHDMFFRTWLKEHLRKCFPRICSVYEAADARGAIQSAREHRPDIICLGRILGDQLLDGVAVAEQIWKSRKKAAILMITGCQSDSYSRRLRNIAPSQASFGWLHESNALQDVSAAIDRLLRGGRWIDANVLEPLGGADGGAPVLTDTEYTALVFIALGLSDRAAAAICCITQQAVQARLRSLYHKLRIPRNRSSICGLPRSEPMPHHGAVRSMCDVFPRG